MTIEGFSIIGGSLKQAEKKKREEMEEIDMIFDDSLLN